MEINNLIFFTVKLRKYCTVIMLSNEHIRKSPHKVETQSKLVNSSGDFQYLYSVTKSIGKLTMMTTIIKNNAKL